MKKIRIGVVGIGHLGNYHLQKYGKIEDCIISGVCDIDEDRAMKAAELYGCRAVRDHRDLVSSVDAVSISVPTLFHYGIAKDFLSAGVDVLLEKPMTSTLEEADDLIAAARKQHALLQIGFVERFNPAIAALSGVIKQPLFIESHRLHPFFNRGTDIDVILDLMIHDLDIVLHFVGSPTVSVDAAGAAILSDKVDIGNARITFENGCVANITASRVTANKLQKIRFFGTEGYHSVDYGKRELLSLHRRIDSDGKPQIEHTPVVVENYDPLEAEIRSFVGAVRTRERPAVSGEDGRASLDLALQIVDKIKVTMERIR
ncbi:MAG: Gfo/Idh/MocA family oxidoreductase [Deltaproteobacteria bacterium]|nr:Gfo/Idh/MocA family oxidoreductase [Deltaproteobacteria bacterium]